MSLLRTGLPNNQTGSKAFRTKAPLCLPEFSRQPNSSPCATRSETAECAATQNKFWEMHDYLYEHQQALDDKHLEKYASELGLDLARLKNDMSTHVHAARVREDFLSGVRSGVNGTPTFYIDNIRYNGSWDLETLLETLGSTIKKAR